MRPLPSAFDPDERLLCGPGPSNVAPRVREALQRPLVSHLDPDFPQVLDELRALIAAAYRAETGLALCLSATGTSGMEAGLRSLVEPGDEVIVCVSGFFGERIAALAHRAGAAVTVLRAELGHAVSAEEVEQALRKSPGARLVCVVHAETSTGVASPLAEIARVVRERSDALVFADCVTSLGGMPVEAEAWGLDYAYSCSQKCLAAPPGLSPVVLSERARARIRDRQVPAPFSYDFEELAAYWVSRPARYHHTVPVLGFYALHEALRAVLEEGLERRWDRHEAVGRSFQRALAADGLELLSAPECTLPQLSAIRVPEGVEGGEVQRRLLREHGIEVGGALGPGYPPIWRIGLMGVNAQLDVATRVLGALEEVLHAEPRRVAAAS
ncbi:MAG TPA: alanine--glyoxylate aminotransferase family protein [Gaiellaceae bacterium]|nr:alanine--glyoxylate aminotransferase family protein [Gaiellaceae bacterium]